jgi:hypothetical protein
MQGRLYSNKNPETNQRAKYHSYYFPSPISRGFGLSEYSEKYSGWFQKSTQTQKEIHPHLKNKSIYIQYKS